MCCFLWCRSPFKTKHQSFLSAPPFYLAKSSSPSLPVNQQ
ncbi:hypothetical protein HMPREF0201_02326 [Cedecea davisae DSM 4568]|uniref:Uncharacterized protein n=1 Tax=Cedecea davisae DSM 4568 TaxID=566551 RepID=S3IUA4_9ENTR|nr:hypothetical protein HMPREF0201_02326 [Cedecea davisae DSM 4568]